MKQEGGKKDGNKTRRRAIAIMAGLAFCILLATVLTGNAAVLDDPVRLFFYGIRNDRLTSIMKIITYMGNWQTIVALCLILLLLKPTRLAYGVPVSAGAIFVTALNKAIKHIIQRPRPDDILHLVQEGGFSFPSGHSITSMFVYGMLIYLIRTNVQNRALANVLTALLCIPLIGVGLSRIYLGVHYPTDVLAGWCLGILTVLAIITIMKKIGRHKA